MTTDRDTCQAGFARALMQELFDLGQGEIDVMEDEAKRREYEQIIARRAYDLVLHVLSNLELIIVNRLSQEEHVLRIPDMTELPEETR